ncbi:MAG: hypothetical protein JRJ29_14390 [Deltaproteobacteria bacterium]|nr:hypothetical protein [Deltaproteobacteria bacterium]
MESRVIVGVTDASKWIPREALQIIPKAVFVLTGIVLSLNPFPHATSIREASYYLALALATAHIVKQRDWSFLRSGFTLPVALFTFWAFVSLFGALDLETSIHDFRSHLLEYIGLFILIVAFCNTAERLQVLMWVVVVSVTISSAGQLYGFYIGGDRALLLRLLPEDPQYPVGPVGFMALHASIFALTLFQVVRRPLSRTILVVCLLVLLATAVAVQTRGLVVAAPLVFVAFFWDNKKLLVISLAAGMVLGAFTIGKLRGNPLEVDYRPRLTFAYVSYLLIREHPVKGIGFGISTFSNPKAIDIEAYRARVPLRFRHPTAAISSSHSMWVGILVRTGLVGGGLFIWIMLKAALMTREVIHKADAEWRRLYGRASAGALVLFSVYGLFNVVSVHSLETLLCLTFAMIAILHGSARSPVSRS